MNFKINYLAVLLSVVLLVSCKDNQAYKKLGNTTSETHNAIHKIVINDFVDAGTYTYIQVNEGEKEYWMAIPNTKVEKGATFYYTGGMLMKNFESEQLNKTFDEIIFVEGISTTEDQATNQVKNPHETGEVPIPSTMDVSISQPTDGVSVEELYAKKESFNNKEVIIKGKVVKVNKAILDKNWVHIVDGTTFGDKKDITITTNEVVNLGDTITFKAKVVLDKDFGGGYVYGLLLENGEIIN
jgi:hypothetical protein